MLAAMLERVRQGDPGARDDLVRAYAPFALGVASRALGRYVHLGEDDEATVTLMALDEAARSFVPGRGAFLALAAQVVRRRLIDHRRRGARAATELPLGVRFSPDEFEGQSLPGSWQLYRGSLAELIVCQQEEGEERRLEILALEAELGQFGVSLEELAAVAPRHRDAREKAIEAARIVAADEVLRDFLRQRRQLPLRELEARCSSSRKTLERQRKYIIAVALILCGDYEYLSEYIGRG
jgi:RNA polymerase sigma factor